MLGLSRLSRLIPLPLLLLLALAPAQISGAAADDAARLMALVNAERAAAGIAALSREPRLAAAAERHAAAMAEGGFFGHEGGDGGALGERLAAAGYAYGFAAENLAAGQPGPEAVLAAWLASPGHRANLFAPRAREAGVGLAETRRGGERGLYWALILAAPLGSADP